MTGQTKTDTVAETPPETGAPEPEAAPRIARDKVADAGRRLTEYARRYLRRWMQRLPLYREKLQDLRRTNLDLGLYHLALGHLFDAALRFRLVRLFSSEKVLPAYYLALVHSQAGKADKAHAVLQTVLSQRPDFRQASQVLDWTRDNDADVVLRLVGEMHRACFPDRGWSDAECLELLEKPHAALFLSGGEQGIAGFGILSVVKEEGEILTMGTQPDSRRQGAARRLLRQMKEFALRQGVERVYLEVRADNDAALALYRAAGFEQTGERTAYYTLADGSKVDAVTMALNLED